MSIQTFFKNQSIFMRSIPLLFRYGLGGALVYYLVRQGQFNLFEIFNKISFVNFIFLLFLKFIILYAASLRWFFVLKELKVELSLVQSLQLNLQTTLFSYFIPGNVSADLFKGIYAAKLYRQGGKIITATFLDRLIGLISMLILMAGSIFLAYPYIEANVNRLISFVKIPAPSYFVILLTVSFLLSGGMIVYWFRKKLEYLMLIILQLKSFVFWFRAISLGLIVHLIFAFFLYQCALILNINEITFVSCLVVVPLATLAMVIPLTPGSIGVGQVLYTSLFDIFLGAKSEAAALFTMNQMMDIPFIFLGIFLFIKSKKVK